MRSTGGSCGARGSARLGNGGGVVCDKCCFTAALIASGPMESGKFIASPLGRFTVVPIYSALPVWGFQLRTRFLGALLPGVIPGTGPGPEAWTLLPQLYLWPASC